MVETLEPSFAYGPPMEAYLRSNYVQQGIKRETSERYTDYDDAELEGLAECLKNDVRQLSAPELAEHLDPDKGLSKIIRKLPAARFSWAEYEPAELTPTLWVNDVPHRITHRTLDHLVQFLESAECARDAPRFKERVVRLIRLPAIRDLPVLVVTPSSYQRSDQAQHLLNPKEPDSPLCDIPYLDDGEAYVEDGNHRAVAQLLSKPCSKLRVVRFDAEGKV